MFWTYLVALWRFHDPIRSFVIHWHLSRLDESADEPRAAMSNRSPRGSAGHIGRRMIRALLKPKRGIR